MKGYSPNLNFKNTTETSSKNQLKFIELGVKQECSNNCDCEKCKTINS